MAVPTSLDLAMKISWPHCDGPVEITVPDREVKAKVSPYVTAFGEHAVVHCPAGHKFWVYYC